MEMLELLARVGETPHWAPLFFAGVVLAGFVAIVATLLIREKRAFDEGVDVVCWIVQAHPNLYAPGPAKGGGLAHVVFYPVPYEKFIANREQAIAELEKLAEKTTRFQNRKPIDGDERILFAITRHGDPVRGVHRVPVRVAGRLVAYHGPLGIRRSLLPDNILTQPFVVCRVAHLGEKNMQIKMAPYPVDAPLEPGFLPSVFAHRGCAVTKVREALVQQCIEDPEYREHRTMLCVGCGRDVPMRDCVWLETGENVLEHIERRRASHASL
ncbi:MAG: hypothetical protein GC159_07760 [Phycisphaera sp.]|nr:hypothetical protein [Phycisphaera sp.]